METEGDSPASKEAQRISKPVFDRQGAGGRRIHPIVVYPYSFPKQTAHLNELYTTLIKGLAEDPGRYARPVTVIDRKTFDKNQYNAEFCQFWEEIIKKYSDPVLSWNVDTCQNWLTGFGYCFDHSKSQGDVFWQIPGDFYYDTDVGHKVLKALKEMPDRVYRGCCELCLGEITVSPNSSKQLIDTYGTYGLLYNWFPQQAQGIRALTDKPRTEFFAIGYKYLKAVLSQRWCAYEQTIIILLHGMNGSRFTRSVDKIQLGHISDLEQGRESLGSAMAQVERTERVLKMYWRDLHEGQDPDWPEAYSKLDFQSEQIRGAALVVLRRILGA